MFVLDLSRCMFILSDVMLAIFPTSFIKFSLSFYDSKKTRMNVVNVNFFQLQSKLTNRPAPDHRLL